MVDCVMCENEIIGKKIRVVTNGRVIAPYKDTTIYNNGRIIYCCEKCYNRNFKE